MTDEPKTRGPRILATMDEVAGTITMRKPGGEPQAHNYNALPRDKTQIATAERSVKVLEWRDRLAGTAPNDDDLLGLTKPAATAEPALEMAAD